MKVRHLRVWVAALLVGALLVGGASSAPIKKLSVDPHSLLDHTLSGATEGQVLVATGASAYTLETLGTRVIPSDTLANRPATPPAGSFYVVTDAGELQSPVLQSYDGYWKTLGAPVEGRHREELFGVWFHGNTSGISTSAGSTELFNSLYPNSAETIELPVTRAGAIRRIEIATSGDIGAAGNSLEVEVYVNGSATSFGTSLNGGSGVERFSWHTWVNAAAIPVSSGDAVTLFAKRTGTLSVRRLVAKLFIAYDY